MTRFQENQIALNDVIERLTKSGSECDETTGTMSATMNWNMTSVSRTNIPETETCQNNERAG